MSEMASCVQRFGHSLFFIATFYVLIVMGGCGAMPLDDTGPRETVYVVRHHWHAGIVVDADLAGEHLPPLPPSLHGARYLELGWGDATFYPADQTNSGMALQALLLPTPSVMHVVALDRDPRDVFARGPMVELVMSRSRVRRMLRFIGRSFQTDPHGRPRALGRGLYGRSSFFKARGFYHGLNTCNVWTARALAAAGEPVFAPTALTVENLMGQLTSTASRPAPRPP
ncbi:MAG: DUF2459 domain-containing protein [Phycisphaeraceae bacterium]|nr:DUF2459 domain-containing protein [Phycisphaeraceae bacterium]